MTYSYDPELAPFAAELPRVDLTDVAAARTHSDEMMAQQSTPVDETCLFVEDYFAPGYDGEAEVALRVYRPRSTDSEDAALLYIHGGGFVVGSILADQEAAATLASTLGVLVVSVAYRLAPEFPFPAGLHDCVAALDWLSQNATKLGVDPARVGVYGSSAGAALAAALTLFSRDHGGPTLCFQFLAIPVLDDRLETESMRKFTDTPGWDRPNSELSWAYYLGATGSKDVSPYAAPARADDLRGLPPAYISTMEFDPLRDEGILYALRLLGSGVPVELHSFPGTFHGSSQITTAAVSRRMAREQMDVLRRALGPKTSD